MSLNSTKSIQVAILITGSEFSLGLKQDTNSKMIADYLRPFGLEISQITLAPDDQQIITSTLQQLANKNQLILVSGGLGPTQDDLTRFALADLTKTSLIQDDATTQHIQELFAKRGRSMSESNKLQALFPDGATIIPNPIGTAAGFLVNHQNCEIICLPGVPRELSAMLTQTVIPKIQSKFKLNLDLETRVIRLLGLPESKVGEMIVELKIPSAISVCYQASFPEIQVILSGNNRSLLDEVFKQTTETITSERIFSNSLELSLEKTVHLELLTSKKTLTLAESCTGGAISALVVSNPDSSQYYLGGINCYSNSAKNRFLDIPYELINEFDAVSPEVAKAMAEGMRANLDSDLALSITGYAGPSGTTNNPAGTYYIGITDRSNQTSITKHFFVGERSAFQRYASYTALHILLNYLRN